MSDCSVLIRRVCWEMSVVSTRSRALWPPISELLRSIFFWSCPGDCAVEPTGSRDQSSNGAGDNRDEQEQAYSHAARHARQLSSRALHGFLHGAGLSDRR